jgi:hypothetical protein
VSTSPGEWASISRERRPTLVAPHRLEISGVDRLGVSVVVVTSWTVAAVVEIGEQLR